MLLDVRDTSDAQALAFDVPECIHLPFSELTRRWRELPTDRDVLLVCKDGIRSAEAAQWLQRKGLTRVKLMRGGILLWMQKGYPVKGQRFEAVPLSDPSLVQLSPADIT